MRAVIQRVKRASVEVDGALTGQVGPGVLILLGVAPDDTEQQVRWLVDKVAGLRIFTDDAGKMNLSLVDIDGAALVVSQFTLYGDCRKGRRPSFTKAAPPAVAEPLYEAYCARLKSLGITVATGIFGADMQVSLVNDGPVTLVIDTP